MGVLPRQRHRAPRGCRAGEAPERAQIDAKPREIHPADLQVLRELWAALRPRRRMGRGPVERGAEDVGGQGPGFLAAPDDKLLRLGLHPGRLEEQTSKPRELAHEDHRPRARPRRPGRVKPGVRGQSLNQRWRRGPGSCAQELEEQLRRNLPRRGKRSLPVLRQTRLPGRLRVGVWTGGVVQSGNPRRSASTRRGPCS